MDTTSADIEMEGWESLPRASTDYRSIILSRELVTGEGSGSRLIIQDGVPSSRDAGEHRDSRVLDLRADGTEADELDDRQIGGSPASGLEYQRAGRVVQTWYVVTDGLRYAINLESEDGAERLNDRALGVLDTIVLG